MAELPNGGISTTSTGALTVAGLFAGIGGIELGLGRAGHKTVFFCEKDAGAQAVLRQHFPTIPLEDDVLALDRLAQWPQSGE